MDLSEFHFQRLFSRWVGISPKRFLQFLTREHAKQLLQNSKNILEAAHETGLSGPGRLHDLFLSCEAVTPGEYKQRGLGLEIRFGISPSPFGPCMIAYTGHGICGLTFVRDRTEDDLKAGLARDWPRAALVRDYDGTRDLAGRIFASARTERPAP